MEYPRLRQRELNVFNVFSSLGVFCTIRSIGCSDSTQIPRRHHQPFVQKCRLFGAEPAVPRELCPSSTWTYHAQQFRPIWFLWHCSDVTPQQWWCLLLKSIVLYPDTSQGGFSYLFFHFFRAIITRASSPAIMGNGLLEPDTDTTGSPRF
jgi:hypothetical protein